MIDPNSNYDKVKVQAWADTFWKIIFFIWLPFFILRQLRREAKARKES